MSLVRASDRTDLAHVMRAHGGRPQIKRFDSFRNEGGEAGDLAHLAQDRRLKRHRFVTLLDTSAYRIVQVEAPAVPPEERVQALRWRIRDAVDFPVDNAVIAVADIPTDGSRQPQVFAVVAPAAEVAGCMANFQHAGMPLEAIDIPEMAVRNVALLFEEPKRGLAFLALTDSDSLLTITWEGELVVSRHIDISARALAQADAERSRQMLERLGLELQRTLDNFDRQFSFISVTRLLVAAEYDCAAVVAALAENLYLPVKAADLADVADFSALPELRSLERQAQGILALGAALREEP